MNARTILGPSRATSRRTATDASMVQCTARPLSSLSRSLHRSPNSSSSSSASPPSSSSALTHDHHLATLTRRHAATLFSVVRTLHQTSLALQRVQKKATQSATASKPVEATNSTSAAPPQQKPSTNSTTPITPTTEAATTTVTDGTPATAPKSLKERAKELWATAKYLFKFYFNGVKQIWANRNRVAEIQQRVAGGGASLTRDESQLIRVHRADMRKLPLFLTILLILEEALPLVVIWAPALLPSTCILPNQLLKIRMKEEVAKATVYKQLNEVEELKCLLPVVSGSGQSLRLNEAHKGADEDVLAKVKGETLTQLAKLFSLSTWGGAAMTRRRLLEHLKYIRSDDEMMCEGGNYACMPQSADAVAKACSERGLRATDVSQKEMFDTLRTWLLYTTRNSSTSKQLSTSSLSLLPLQLYNPRSMQEIEASLAAERERGLIEKTKDVLNEVVQEKKLLARDQQAGEVKAKSQSSRR